MASIVRLPWSAPGGCVHEQLTIRSKRLLISILNWNGIEDTLKCIDSLGANGQMDWHVLVIDNGSTHDPRQTLHERFPLVECIRVDQNLGFAGGQNIGMKIAVDRGYETVMLLNNDCEIAPLAVEQMLSEIASNERTAAVSPLIYCSDRPEKPQIVSGWFDWPNHCTVRPSKPDVATPLGMATMLPGTVLMLRCAALSRIGFLDERYFAYYEDNDLSARIAASGYQAIFCKSAIALHSSRQVHEYSEMALYLSARNARMFWREHTPGKYRSGLSRHLLAQSLYEMISLKKAGARDKCKAVSAGFWDGLLGRTGRPPTTILAPKLVHALMYIVPYRIIALLSAPA